MLVEVYFKKNLVVPVAILQLQYSQSSNSSYKLSNVCMIRTHCSRLAGMFDVMNPDGFSCFNGPLIYYFGCGMGCGHR